MEGSRDTMGSRRKEFSMVRYELRNVAKSGENVRTWGGGRWVWDVERSTSSESGIWGMEGTLRPGSDVDEVPVATSQLDGGMPFFSLSDMDEANKVAAFSIELAIYPRTAASNGEASSGRNSSPTLAKEVPQ